MGLRWEWRMFGEDLGHAGNRLGSREPERVAESDETYLLSSADGVAVKARDGLMDVKHRVVVGDDGLELWKPVMKSPLPIPADDARAVLDALGVTAPSLARRSCGLEDIAVAGAGVVAVAVHKTRRHHRFGGCMAELTDIRTAFGATRSIAIECEDAARVVAAVRELGLDPYENVNVPQGLKALLHLAQSQRSTARAQTHA
jgi:exopolyphosphatase / guanosine-5'-triphosphate,3'-diphosphate pyrophosphatase